MTLPRTTLLPAGIQERYAEWMSPLAPMQPTSPLGTDARRIDFPVGYNYTWVPRSYDGISFEQLRNMAESDYIVRACIETVKDQMGKLAWRVGLKPSTDQTLNQAKRNSDKDSDVQEVRKFFLRPDNEHDFSDWLRLLLEDMLSIDAANLMVDGTIGNIRRLIPTDGSMYHVNIDKDGLRPMPPDPAYTQVVKGMPHVAMTTNELIYMPHNPRTNRLYGYSPVEQIIFFTNIALRRDISKMSIYTVGNVPEALIAAPQTWSPAQIQQFQEFLDSTLSGQLGARRKMTMVPNIGDPGKPASIKDSVLFTKEDVIKDEFDEWRARVSCFFFSLPPTAFVKQMNRASAQQQQKQALEEGIEPRKIWFKNKLDWIIEYYLKKPRVEFNWEDDPEVDPLVQAEVDKIYISIGKTSIDECRERDGQDKVGIGNLIITTQGPILLADVKSGEGKVLPNKEVPQPVGTSDPLLANPSRTGSSAGKSGARSLQKLLASATLDDIIKKKIDVRTDELPEKVNKRVNVLARNLFRFLKTAGKKLAYKAADEYGMRKAAQSDEQRLNEIMADLGLDWIQVVQLVETPIAETAGEEGSTVLLQLGFDESATALFGAVNQDALSFAEQRAAELVGKKYVNGILVDNPNAEYAITETTREELRQLIAKAFSEGMSPKQLADSIENSFQFSEARAKLIAQTEMTRAHIEGALAAANASGVVKKKFSRLSADHDIDDECDANAQTGPIPLTQDFPSGQPGPPFHPNCMCTLSFTYRDKEK